MAKTINRCFQEQSAAAFCFQWAMPGSNHHKEAMNDGAPLTPGNAVVAPHLVSTAGSILSSRARPSLLFLTTNNQDDSASLRQHNPHSAGARWPTWVLLTRSGRLTTQRRRDRYDWYSCALVHLAQYGRQPVLAMACVLLPFGRGQKFRQAIHNSIQFNSIHFNSI